MRGMKGQTLSPLSVSGHWPETGFWERCKDRRSMSLGHVTGEKEIDPRAGAQRILSSPAGSEPQMRKPLLRLACAYVD
jgi:hypothetical protein